MFKENINKLKINFWFLAASFALIFLSVAVTNVLFVKSNSILNKKLSETAEANRPANIDLILLTDKNCPDCFDTTPLLNQIEKENVKINSRRILDKNSEEGKQFIEKFAIKKLPTFLMTGELEKNSILAKFFSQAGDTTDDTFVFRDVGGPYVDVATGKIKGRVNLVLITDITCTECYEVTKHETILKQFSMQPASKVVDVKSAEGRALVNRYGIKLVPTFILTGEVKEYPSFVSIWPQVGVVAYDGAYVFTKGVEFMGVYKNITTNKVITPEPQSNE